MSGVKYKAKYDFTATQSGTLGFKAGDVFVFVSKSTEDWWSMRTPNGQIGLVPATYLDELKARLHGMRRIEKEPSAAKESVPVAYRALYDYTGANGSQLTFKQGDTMVLVDTPSTGWWSMRHTSSGKQGLVPTNYVEKDSSNGNPAGGGGGGGSGEPNLKDEKVLAEVLLSIDRAIEAIHVETTKTGGVVTAQQRTALTRLLQHRQQTIAMSKQDSIASQDHTTLAQTGTREVSPPTTAVLATPTLPTPASQPNLQPATSGGRQSVYIPSHESGDPSNTGDQLRQRSSTLPRRQPPPPPKRDERYTLSTAQSPSSSRGEPKEFGVRREGIDLGPQLSHTPYHQHHHHHQGSEWSLHHHTRESLQGRTNGVPFQSPVGHEDLPQTSPSLPPRPREGRGAKGEEGLVLVTRNWWPCCRLSATTSPSPWRRRSRALTLAARLGPQSMPLGPRSALAPSPTLAALHPGGRPILSLPWSPYCPPCRGVNEAAAIAMPTATPPVTTPTTTSSTAVAVVTVAAVPIATPSTTPTTTSAAVASSKSPAPVLAPPPPATPTLRTQFTDKEAGELVEVVRVGTGMSYKNTLTAVGGVLDFLKTKVPACSDMVEGLLRALQSSQTGVSTASGDQLDCKDDTQQRGWAVHDDHHIISGYLSELLQLLCDADPDISRRVIKEDKYENVLTLIEFYHLEPRVPLRLLMLKIFAALCELDHTIIGILLSSVLPNELGRDIQQGISETEKALYSSTVCTIIFSTGEAVPMSLYDQWNQDYILFLLDTIEQPPSSDRQELLPDAFMNVVLAYNQHFQDPASNIVMSALKTRPNPKSFSEKLMMLVNRGEDPVAGHCEPNALLKVMLDMFSDKATSSIFYTTDLMVLIDIIHRQLSDMEAGSKTRTHYLELLYRVLSTTEYTEHNRRQRELTICLSRIAREDLEESKSDRELVARIHTAFPLLFEESTVI
ncbi:hypothetical protein EMCRGX_G002898 [Ephydatia muelleri]